MSKPALGVVGTESAPDSWDELMAEGAQRALRQVLAKRPLSVTICYEPRGETPEFNFVSFPPGVAAGLYICKIIAEAQSNDDD